MKAAKRKKKGKERKGKERAEREERLERQYNKMERRQVAYPCLNNEGGKEQEKARKKNIEKLERRETTRKEGSYLTHA